MKMLIQTGYCQTLSHKTQVKKKSNELGFAFSKKDSFYACLPVLLEIEEKLCCLFQFSPKSVQCSVHRVSKNKCHIFDKSIFRL